MPNKGAVSLALKLLGRIDQYVQIHPHVQSLIEGCRSGDKILTGRHHDQEIQVCEKVPLPSRVRPKKNHPLDLGHPGQLLPGPFERMIQCQAVLPSSLPQ